MACLVLPIFSRNAENCVILRRFLGHGSVPRALHPIIQVQQPHLSALFISHQKNKTHPRTKIQVPNCSHVRKILNIFHHNVKASRIQTRDRASHWKWCTWCWNCSQPISVRRSSYIWAALLLNSKPTSQVQMCSSLSQLNLHWTQAQNNPLWHCSDSTYIITETIPHKSNVWSVFRCLVFFELGWLKFAAKRDHMTLHWECFSAFESGSFSWFCWLFGVIVHKPMVWRNLKVLSIHLTCFRWVFFHFSIVFLCFHDHCEQ